MTFQFLPQSVASGAMRKRNVIICNIIEEVKFILFEHQTSGDGMDGSIAPALVEETSIAVEGIEEVDVGL